MILLTLLKFLTMMIYGCLGAILVILGIHVFVEWRKHRLLRKHFLYINDTTRQCRRCLQYQFYIFDTLTGVRSWMGWNHPSYTATCNCCHQYILVDQQEKQNGKEE